MNMAFASVNGDCRPAAFTARPVGAELGV